MRLRRLLVKSWSIAGVALLLLALAAPAPAAAERRIGHLSVEVFVPPGYGTDTQRRWPVLYVVPGSGDTAANAMDDLALRSWSGRNDALVAIVWEPYVVHEGDSVGWNFIVDYHDGRKPLDTEFVKQVVPWVDSTYRTIPDAGHRIIAGYSSGGYSAAAVASRHPGLFGAMGSFSGVVDLTDRYPIGPWEVLFPFLLDAPEVTLFRPWGNPVTDVANWHAQNPTDMAGRLKGKLVYIAAGNGVPADLSEAREIAGNLGVPQIIVEEQVGSMNRAYDAALTQAGVAHTYRPHRGAHSARHWRDDLRTFWPLVRAKLGL